MSQISLSEDEINEFCRELFSEIMNFFVNCLWLVKTVLGLTEGPAEAGDLVGVVVGVLNVGIGDGRFEGASEPQNFP